MHGANRTRTATSICSWFYRSRTSPPIEGPVLVEGDKSLFNPYGVMVVDAARHPHVKQALAQQFSDWITSSAGQAAIASYKIGGEQLFFPSADRL